MEMTPEQTIARIAEVANAVARQAGVGGMEIAGQIISVLARHPDHVEWFLKDGSGALIEMDVFRAECGCLTFFSAAGEVVTPQQLHAAREIQKIKQGLPKAMGEG